MAVTSWFVIALLVGLCLVGWCLDASLSGRERSVSPEDRAHALGLRAETPVLSRGLRSAPRQADAVAVTFSGGADAEWLRDVTAIMHRHGASATFFLTGQSVVQHSEEVELLVNSRFELGSNGFAETDLSKLADWQIRLHLSVTRSVLASITGRSTRLFRPPGSQSLAGIDGSDVGVLRVGIDAGYTDVLADRIVPVWNTGRDTGQLVVDALPAPGVSSVVEFPTPPPARRAEVARVLEFVITALQSRNTQLLDISHYAGLRPDAVDGPISGWSRAGGEVLAHGLPVFTGARELVHLLAGLLLVVGIARVLGGVAIALRRRRATAGGPPPPNPAVRPTVTVLIAARDEASHIGATLDTLRDSTYPCLEIIVVDDGSNDGTASVAASVMGMGPSPVSVHRQIGMGKPAALNFGLLVASGDIVVCIDADTRVEPETIGNLVAPFADPRVGAVTGHVLVDNAGGLLGRFQRAEYSVGCTIERQLLNHIGFMTCITGAVAALRRVALAGVGGFSADTCAEDTDLALALQRHGWSVIYQPDARAHTRVPRTIRALWTQRVRWSLGVFQSIWKHRAWLSTGSGDSGRAGRRAIPYLVVFGGLSVLGPLVDAVAVFAIVTTRLDWLVVVWGLLVTLATGVTALAFFAERQPIRRAWIVPLQILFYRPFLYLAQIRALQLASAGLVPRWRRNRERRARQRHVEPTEALEPLWAALAASLLEPPRRLGRTVAPVLPFLFEELPAWTSPAHAETPQTDGDAHPVDTGRTTASHPKHRLALIDAGVSLGVVIALFAGVVAFRLGSPAAGASPSSPATRPSAALARTVPTVTALATRLEPEPVPRAVLTGRPLDPAAAGGVATRRTIAVKIDDAPAVHTHPGLDAADTVFEVAVEGGLTRYLALYQSATPQRVGPVRSVRTTDFNLLRGLGTPVLAFSGGNKATVAHTMALPIVAFPPSRADGGVYRRDPALSAPHNLFLSPAAVWSHVLGGGNPEPVFANPRSEVSLGLDALPASGLQINFSGVADSTFVWDRVSQQWLRYQRGHVQLDGERRPLHFDNVIVLQTTYRVSPYDSRSPEAVSVGEGSAIILHGGTAMTLRWARASAQEPFRLLSDDGALVELPAGRSWIAMPGETAMGHGTVTFLTPEAVEKLIEGSG